MIGGNKPLRADRLKDPAETDMWARHRIGPADPREAKRDRRSRIEGAAEPKASSGQDRDDIIAAGLALALCVASVAAIAAIVAAVAAIVLWSM